MNPSKTYVCLDPKILGCNEIAQQQILDLIKICGLTVVVERDPPKQSEFFRRARNADLKNSWCTALDQFEIKVVTNDKVSDFADLNDDAYFRKFAPQFFVTTQNNLRPLIAANKNYFYFEESRSIGYRDSIDGTILGAEVAICTAPNFPLLGKGYLDRVPVEKTPAGKARIKELFREFGSVNSIVKIFDKLLMLKVGHRLKPTFRRYSNHIDSYDLIDAVCQGSSVKTIEIYSKHECSSHSESMSLNELTDVYKAIADLILSHGKEFKFFILKSDVDYEYEQGNPEDSAYVWGSTGLIDWSHLSVAFTKSGKTRYQVYNSNKRKTWITDADLQFLKNKENLVDFSRKDLY